MLLQFHTGGRLATLEVVPGAGGACRVLLDGTPVAVEPCGEDGPGRCDLRLDGRRVRARVVAAGPAVHVSIDGRARVLLRHTGDEEADEAVAAGGPRVTAPLPGRIVRVLVAVGDTVRAGEALLTLEAMKMETDVAAPLAGAVRAVHVAAGGTVALGDPLVDLAPA
ncbi:MAG: acyl-CoA carboxylase biotin carboxyl carrier protein subunit [Candidatus Krumholzibacteriia bacterium]